MVKFSTHLSFYIVYMYNMHCTYTINFYNVGTHQVDKIMSGII